MPQELDIIWNAQRGKHDAIQRNLHDLIAKLINLFSNELQEKLFALMKVVIFYFEVFAKR